SYPKGGGEHYLIAGTTKSYQCAIAADATAIACLHMKPLDSSPASLFTTSTSNPNVKEPTINRVETREDNLEDRAKPLRSSMSRRSFLGTSLAVGAGTIGAGLLANAPTASASVDLTVGDADILRFLAAAEIIEADLWQQYNELGGIQDPEVPGGTGNPAYTAALAVLDEDMDQYIHDNTDDEISHFTFLNAFLASKGAEPVNLDQFRTLPSSQATGAQQIGRLTNNDGLRILLSIGGDEIMHFQTWQDKAGNAPPLTDPTNGLVFPDLNADGELTQTNLIMPEPTIFLRRRFPICSIIRPTETRGAAMAALNAFTADGLFIG